MLAKLRLAQPGPPIAKPLEFLLQIDLAELQRVAPSADLPQAGLLTFFYDVVGQPWGFDPAHLDGFRVVLFDCDIAASRPVPVSSALPARGLLFWPSVTVPHIGSRAYEALIEDCELPHSYIEFAEDLERRRYPPERGLHRLFGHSANIQGDMQLEAQLVSNGLYCGSAAGYRDPRVASLERGASDWVLLLQLDSDDSVNMMWGDVGMLYFWIRKDDLATRRFDRAWASLQCG